VTHEPLNPKFRFIKFPDFPEVEPERLWVHPSTPTLRHVELIVEPNPDTGFGGWVIVREARRL
jgi:hypothetical protein